MKSTARNSKGDLDTMNKPQGARKSVFATPWFQIFAEQSPDRGQPHYVIEGKDFVVVVAVTRQKV